MKQQYTALEKGIITDLMDLSLQHGPVEIQLTAETEDTGDFAPAIIVRTAPDGVLRGLTEDDRIAGRNGDSGNFSSDLPAVRYIRIRCLKNWSGNTNMTFTEISFWGDDKVQQ